MINLKKSIRSIPDFPKKGIVFRDITTLLAEPAAYQQTLVEMGKFAKRKNANKIVAIESRGFIFGGALANNLGVPFVPARKPGKLPAATIKQEYQLEYGSDAIEIHVDAIKPGDHILIVDDLIATGGTLEAVCKLVEKMGAHVAGVAAVIDLAFIPWRDRLSTYDVFTLISYNSEVE